MIRNWHWRNEEGRGRITLTWYLNCDSHRMGIIRVHKDKNIVPGYFEAVGTVLVEEGEYELLGFHADPGRNPPISEFKEVYAKLDEYGTRRRVDRAK